MLALVVAVVAILMHQTVAATTTTSTGKFIQKLNFGNDDMFQVLSPDHGVKTKGQPVKELEEEVGKITHLTLSHSVVYICCRCIECAGRVGTCL